MSNETFTCKGCNHELPEVYSIKPGGYCYLCDPNVTVKELLESTTFDKNEALKRMKKGEKVTHKSMMPDEYLYVVDEGDTIFTEDGFDFTASFWSKNLSHYENGWTKYEI